MDPLSLLWLFFILASLQPAAERYLLEARRAESAMRLATGCRATVTHNLICRGFHAASGFRNKTHLRQSRTTLARRPETWLSGATAPQETSLFPAGFQNGRGWDRTSDLPRVKRALSR